MPLAKPELPPQKVDWLGNPVCPKCGKGMQELCGRDYCEHCKHEVPWPKSLKWRLLHRLVCWTYLHKLPLRELEGKFVQCLRCGDIWKPSILPVDPWPERPSAPKPPGPPPPPSTKERIQAVSHDIDQVCKQIAKLEAKRLYLSIRLKELKDEDK